MDGWMDAPTVQQLDYLRREAITEEGGVQFDASVTFFQCQHLFL